MREEVKKKNKTVSLIKNILFYFIVIVLSLHIVGSAIAKNGAIPFTGFRTYNVKTGSMVPVIKINDVIVVTKVDNKNIKGDMIIAFSTHAKAVDGKTMVPIIVTHYVRYITEDGIYLTQGNGLALFKEEVFIKNNADDTYEKIDYYDENLTYYDKSHIELTWKDGKLFRSTYQVTNFDEDLLDKDGNVDVITADQIIGKYQFKIPWIGTILRHFENVTPTLVILLAVNGVIIYFLIVMIFKKDDKKNVDETDQEGKE